MQKWPNTVTLIRHGESAYNASDIKSAPGFKEFKALYDKEFKKLDARALAEGTFPSPQLLEMARKLCAEFSPTVNDFDTPLTGNGWTQAFETGEALPGKVPLPDAVYVSPYIRTRETLKGLIKGWPELRGVKILEDDRLREQEHGKKTIYPHAALYFVFNPQYALLKKLSTTYEYKHEGGESMLDVRERARSIIETLIREHGGLSGYTPENVMLVTHHRLILAMRADLDRWGRKEFLHEEEHNKPVNCGVTIYRGMPTDPGRSRQGSLGRLVLEPAEYNMKLYEGI